MNFRKKRERNEVSAWFSKSLSFRKYSSLRFDGIVSVKHFCSNIHRAVIIVIRVRVEFAKTSLL